MGTLIDRSSTSDGPGPKLSSLKTAPMPSMAAGLRVGADWLARASLQRRGEDRRELLGAAETHRRLAQAIEDGRVTIEDLDLLARCARGSTPPVPPPPPPPGGASVLSVKVA